MLTKSDQATVWAFTSYVINFNIMADEEKKTPLGMGN